MKKAFVLIAFLLFFSLATSASAQEIDFLVQGDGYAPPFYKGRVPWGRQTVVTVYALPSIPGYSAASLMYKWTRDGVVLGGPQGLNGIGKNTLTLVDSILGKSPNIKLELFSAGGEYLHGESITIRSVPQEVLIYEDNPIYGYLFNWEAGSRYTMRESEMTLAAFPMFFSTPNRFLDTMSYEWRMRRGPTQSSANITYRAPEGDAGTSQVSLRAKHVTEVLQERSRDVVIEFGQ